MKRIILVVHSSTYFIELLRVARLLERSETHEPVMLFVREYPTVARDVGVCLVEQIACLGPNGELIVPSSNIPSVVAGSSNWRIRVRQCVKRCLDYLPDAPRKWIRRLLLSWLAGLQVTLVYQLWLFRNRIRFVRRLVYQQQPSLLVLGGDSVGLGYDTSVFIQVAHQHGIPAVIVSSTMSNGLEEAEAFYHNPLYNVQRWSNRLAGLFLPRWVYEHRGRKLLRVPAGRVLAMEWLGLAPPLPWIFNSGYADAIAVESEAMLQYYRQAGLPLEQLTLIGSLADDVLAENLQKAAQRRADLYQRLGLPPGQPMLLSALPPDFLEMVGGRPECDFRTYADLVRFWVQSLATVIGYSIVISLHPSVTYDDMKYIEQWGVKIAAEQTADLIPLCDIYVASVSSTIRWAIACGKPVVNYDVYRYRYTDYVEVGGVIIVEEQSKFLSVLQRLTRVPEFYAEIAARQAACAEQWGRLDGRASERMLQLFDQLVSQYENRASF